MIESININRVEIIGALLAFIYLIFEIKRKWFFWIIGIISSGFYVYIYFYKKLYAEMVLNFYYILMSAYGLYCWKFSQKANVENEGFHNINMKTSFVLSLLFIILFAFIFIILHRFTDSQVPIPDALITVLSFIATWMSAKKIIECWYLWIFANFLATGLYIYLKLYPTAVLFTVYTVLSFVGLIEWRKSIKNNDSTYTKL